MVQYICRQCGWRIGQYIGPWDTPKLGLTSLTPEDQNEMLLHHDQGHTTVRVLCDNCLPIPWEDTLWYN